MAALGLALGVALAATDSAGASSQARVQSRAAALPSWAIGPFTRYLHNPVLRPVVVPGTSNRWEWPELFNPGVVVVKGIFHMLYRGTDFDGVSSIGAATSTDGYHFTLESSSPVIAPVLPSENEGVEDPRLYHLKGKYYSFFTGDGAIGGAMIDINEAVSTNARDWTQLGPVLDNTKDAAVVASPAGTPVRIGGYYLMYYGQQGGTYLARSADLIHWTTVGQISVPFPAAYSPWEFCVALTNYRTTAKGSAHADIDLFVAGHLMGRGRWYYAISEIEFDRARPLTVEATLKAPVLYPEAPYEIYGHTPNTVFMNDLIYYRGQWWMYYGAGDSVVGLAQAKLRA